MMPWRWARTASNWIEHSMARGAATVYDATGVKPAIWNLSGS